MADPVVVSCPQGVWTKVATNVTSGAIQRFERKRILTKTTFLHTYRDTGNPAPSDLSDAMVLTEDTLLINSTAGVDVYIYAQNRTGNVRVEL